MEKYHKRIIFETLFYTVDYEMKISPKDENQITIFEI